MPMMMGTEGQLAVVWVIKKKKKLMDPSPVSKFSMIIIYIIITTVGGHHFSFCFYLEKMYL